MNTACVAGLSEHYRKHSLLYVSCLSLSPVSADVGSMVVPGVVDVAGSPTVCLFVFIKFRSKLGDDIMLDKPVTVLSRVWQCFYF